MKNCHSINELIGDTINIENEHGLWLNIKLNIHKIYNLKQLKHLFQTQGGWRKQNNTKVPEITVETGTL